MADPKRALKGVTGAIGGAAAGGVVGALSGAVGGATQFGVPIGLIIGVISVATGNGFAGFLSAFIGTIVTCTIVFAIIGIEWV